MNIEYEEVFKNSKRNGSMTQGRNQGQRGTLPLPK